MLKLVNTALILITVLQVPAFAKSQNSSTDLSDKNLMPMSFVEIKPGKFMMGSSDGTNGIPAENIRNSDETFHEVTLTHGFEMQVTDVTQGQWYKVTKVARNRNLSLAPSYFTKIENCPGGNKKIGENQFCPNHPVEQVSWFDAIQFANQFSIQKHLKPCYIIKYVITATQSYSVTVDAPGGNIYECVGYRLPTEAEWEYAARAGTTTTYSFGDDESLLSNYGISYQNNPGSQNEPQTAEVGSLSPNPWGLYDMHGEVWQWVEDYYGTYPRDAVTDPTGPSSGAFRALRGGSWDVGTHNLRSAVRSDNGQDYRYSNIGFRLVRTLRGVK